MNVNVHKVCLIAWYGNDIASTLNRHDMMTIMTLKATYMKNNNTNLHLQVLQGCTATEYWFAKPLIPTARNI